MNTSSAMHVTDMMAVRMITHHSLQSLLLPNKNDVSEATTTVDSPESPDSNGSDGDGLTVGSGSKTTSCMETSLPELSTQVYLPALLFWACRKITI
jgi:hypothetical protein